MIRFGPPIDTRPLFPRERCRLIELLEQLEPSDWDRATVCPGWAVRDIVAHLVNDYLRRLSGSRDGYPGAIFADDETLPAYLARTNEEFVRAARQCSPRVLVDLLECFGPQLDELWSTMELSDPAPLNVTWADPDAPSPAWLDIARDYTEYWVHQQQIRDAVGRPGADEPELLAPVLDTFLRALPYTLRDEAPPVGTVVAFEITGPAGGEWRVTRRADRWGWSDDSADDTAGETAALDPAARVVMSSDTAWRLATRNIEVEEARARSELHGDPELTRAATTLLGIIR